MSDSAFPTGDYASMTTAQLRAIADSEPHISPRMHAELIRRARVERGDVSAMTYGERLRHARRA